MLLMVFATNMAFGALGQEAKAEECQGFELEMRTLEHSFTQESFAEHLVEHNYVMPVAKVKMQAF